MQMSTYFAALPPDEVVPELHKRVEAYYDALRQNGHLDKIRKTYEMYYALGRYNSSFVHEGGEQGEQLNVAINHLRSIVNHILVLTTQNRPALKAVAVNSDYASQAAARLADLLLDYYFKTRNIEQLLKDATELALITGKGYVVMRWDTQAGKEYGATADGRVIYDGDVSASVKSCLEVAEDIYSESSDWYVVRELRNKHDIAAQYPELADQIVLLQEPDDVDYRFRTWARTEQDLISHYTFVHKKTAAVPNGRQVEFLAEDVLLTDGPLPYKQPLVFPIYPSKIKGTQLGYSPAFDLLAVNEALNDTWSSIVTNVATFGKSNVWTPTGSNIQASVLEGGLNHIESDVKPEAINLATMPPELFQVTERLQGQMEVLSGINDVVRGDPQASLKSGSALALVASQALAYNSGLQASYSDLLMSTGNGVIWLLQDYASTPRMATIVGQANKSTLKAFTGDKLKAIDRVIAEQVSAVSRTTAGRMELADNLLDRQMLPSPESYLTFIETGRLEPTMGSEVSEDMLITQENELLRDGTEQVQAVLTENHVRHIKGHRQVLADPYAKLDPNLVQRVLDHIQEHINIGMSPAYQQLAPLFGHQPIQPAAPPTPPPNQGPVDAGEMVQPPPGAGEMPNQPNLPSLPDGSPQELQQPYQQATQQGVPQ